MSAFETMTMENIIIPEGYKLLSPNNCDDIYYRIVICSEALTKLHIWHMKGKFLYYGNYDNFDLYYKDTEQNSDVILMPKKILSLTESAKKTITLISTNLH